jgi:5-methylcytosine-specific restriction endonuclease McrBC regulatory subunit McrC
MWRWQYQRPSTCAIACAGAPPGPAVQGSPLTLRSQKGSDSSGMALRGIGRLKPDILVRRPDGSVCAVIDAKYKPLAFRRPDRLDGVDRADLYQLTSYLSRFGTDNDTIGALLYPDALLDPGHTPARAKGVSWSIDDRWKVRFETVPVTLEAAVPRLRELFALPSEPVGFPRFD